MTDKKPSVLVVGSINMDVVLEVNRMPRGGESLIGKSFQYIPGGKGANQATAAARLGADTYFVGRIGRDANGIKLKEQLEEEGINTELCKFHDSAQSGMAVIILEETGENRILVYPGANMKIQKTDIN